MGLQRNRRMTNTYKWDRWIGNQLEWHKKERSRLFELAEAAVRAHQGPLTREMDALMTYLNETPKELKR